MHAIKQILTPARTVAKVQGVSKKRLFETIAKVVCDDQESLSYDSVLEQLVAREKLGSTGLGQGIAIPHCRIDNCAEPLGTLITLEEPIPFDAPDEQPVDLLFILLVPAEAAQQHLDILAGIARLFSDANYCQGLRDASDDHTLYQHACAVGD